MPEFNDVADTGGATTEGGEMENAAGSYVIVRSRNAGVHAGTIVRIDGDTVRLTKSRRLWWWKCLKGDFLSGVARHGLSSESKVGGEVEITVLGVCEIISCTPEAQESIEGCAEHLG